MTLRRIILLLLLAPSAAHASCFDHCSALCKQNPGDLDAITCTSRCTTPCVEDSNGNYSFTTPPPVTAITEKFGAIAMSPTTLESGYAFGFTTGAQAEQEALKHCHDDYKTHAPDCKSLLTFVNSCAALALNTSATATGGSWGTAWAETPAEAEQKAQESCKVMASEDCTIAHSFCSR